jgi:hypothetical protein
VTEFRFDIITFLAAVFLGAGAFLAGDLAGEGGAAGAGASTFLGASFLGAVFFGAAFFAAVFLGAVFFAAGFLGEAAFFGSVFFAGAAFFAAICKHRQVTDWVFQVDGRTAAWASCTHLVIGVAQKKRGPYIVFANRCHMYNLYKVVFRVYNWSAHNSNLCFGEF